MINDFKTDVKNKEEQKEIKAEKKDKEKKPKKKDKKDKKKKKDDISSMSDNSMYTPEQKAKWKERGKDFSGMSLYDHQQELMEWERVYDELEANIEHGNEFLQLETKRKDKKKRKGKFGEVIDENYMTEEEKRQA